MSAPTYIIVESFWESQEIHGAFSTFDLAADAVATLIETGRAHAGAIAIVAVPVDDLYAGESAAFVESHWDEIKKRLAHGPEVVERVYAELAI